MLEDAVVAGVTELALLELLRQRLVKTVPVATPAAGAEWSQAVPAGVAWELLAVHIRFVASAVVANRFPTIFARDDTNAELARFGTAAATTANGALAGGGSAGLGQNVSGGTSYFTLPSPPWLMLPGWSLISNTSGIDVGDQWSQVILIVREWSIREALLNIEWLKNHAR